MWFTVNDETVYYASLGSIGQGVVEDHRRFIIGFGIQVSVATASEEFLLRDALRRVLFVADGLSGAERERFVELALSEEVFKFELRVPSWRS